MSKVFRLGIWEQSRARLLERKVFYMLRVFVSWFNSSPTFCCGCEIEKLDSFHKLAVLWVFFIQERLWAVTRVMNKYAWVCYFTNVKEKSRLVEATL
jgi:hypothetical protein